MSAAGGQKELAERVEQLRAQYGDSVRLDRVAEVMRAMLDSLMAHPPVDARLYHEVEALASYIHEARAEIAALRPSELQNVYIASATDELDAIVDATEKATNSILDAAERIENALGEAPPELGRLLSEATTQIYEACNFQDITGQRITKVVKALKHIEEKIDALVAAFGPEVDRAAEQAAREQEQEKRPIRDEDLLNGPQLPGNASRQDEIDALLASFD